MAPEYAMQGLFSVKSDVFSFGVLVLEIVTGKIQSFRNGDDIEHLVSHVSRIIHHSHTLYKALYEYFPALQYYEFTLDKIYRHGETGGKGILKIL